MTGYVGRLILMSQTSAAAHFEAADRAIRSAESVAMTAPPSADIYLRAAELHIRLGEAMRSPRERFTAGRRPDVPPPAPVAAAR